MGLATDAGRPPAIPHVQAPPPGLTRARWLYVDEALSHEVHAGIRVLPRSEFVIREAAYGNTDPGETYETVIPLGEPWEAQLHHLELETRLGLLGRYWRNDAQRPGWTRLRSPPAGESLDLREVDVPLFPGDATFWHFHPRRVGPEVVLVRLPHWYPTGLRFLVARAEFKHPDSERGEITLLHGRLPLTPMRSVLAREHRDLSTKHTHKLVRSDDFRLVHGEDWKLQLLEAYRGILDRIAHGAWGKPQAEKPKEMPVDSLYTDYVKWLNDPRVAALHAKFLTPEEEASLMAGGEEFIKQAMSRVRARTPRAEQHLVNLLEASLLARDGLRHGVHKVDPEVAALVRRFAFYL